jgi:hypothetical protein
MSSSGLPRWLPKNDTVPVPGQGGLGSGGALTLTTTPPPGAASSSDLRIWVQWGVVGLVVPSNIYDPIVLLSAGTGRVWLRVGYSGSGIASVVIERGPTVPTPTAPPADAQYAVESIYLLGQVTTAVVGGVLRITNLSSTGEGSLQLYWAPITQTCRPPNHDDPENPEPGGTYVSFMANLYRG